MNLTQEVTPARWTWTGNERFTLAAGKRLEIRTKTPTETLLDVEVPAGKQWTVYVSVTCDETAV